MWIIFSFFIFFIVYSFKSNSLLVRWREYFIEGGLGTKHRVERYIIWEKTKASQFHGFAILTLNNSSAYFSLLYIYIYFMGQNHENCWLIANRWREAQGCAFRWSKYSQKQSFPITWRSVLSGWEKADKICGGFKMKRVSQLSTHYDRVVGGVYGSSY